MHLSRSLELRKRSEFFFFPRTLRWSDSINRQFPAGIGSGIYAIHKRSRAIKRANWSQRYRFLIYLFSQTSPENCSECYYCEIRKRRQIVIFGLMALLSVFRSFSCCLFCSRICIRCPKWNYVRRRNGFKQEIDEKFLNRITVDCNNKITICKANPKTALVILVIFFWLLFNFRPFATWKFGHWRVLFSTSPRQNYYIETTRS